jgi:TonB-dependent receptor
MNFDPDVSAIMRDKQVRGCVMGTKNVRLAPGPGVRRGWQGMWVGGGAGVWRVLAGGAVGVRRVFTRGALAVWVLCAVGAPALAADAVGVSEDQQSNSPPLTAQASAAQGGPVLEEVVVTGVRRSLTDAATAKRTATNFSDSIFAEDVAKFSDNDVAEALNRAPGVLLTRDVNGNGIDISIRGLGPSFTKILLNGSQVNVASDGPIGVGQSDREVDLDLFPIELFTKLTIEKTPLADTLEGGIAGTVNMVNARPFDNPGAHLAGTFSEGYSAASQGENPRGAIIASNTWGPFGALVGVAASTSPLRVDGFESIGWTTANLSAAQCNVASCNTDGGKGFTVPATVPSTAGNGLVTGAPVDAAFLAAHNPNVSLAQLGSALLPRLGRDEFFDGSQARQSVLVALEYRPSEKLHFNLDMLYGHRKDVFQQLDMDWAVRNSNGMIPLNVNVDSNNVVTSGTFANSQFFVESANLRNGLDFYNVNPSVEYDFSDRIKLEGQVNDNRSTLFRQEPTYDFNSPLGITVNYSDHGGVVPTISPSADLNNPGLGWSWYRENLQNVARKTIDRGTHWDLTLGDPSANLKIGFAYDGAYRSITAFDGSSWYSNCVINGGTSTTVNGQVFPCVPNSMVPNSAIGGYLSAGPASNFYHLGSGNLGYTQFVQPNVQALEAATNYGFYNANAPFSATSATAAPSGTIDEKNTGGYVEFNGKGQFWDHDVNYNAGIRYVKTSQIVGQQVMLNNVFVPTTISHPYDAFLPSFNAATALVDNLIFRIAGSRTMTRPNPDQLLPGVTFSDPAAQVASAGNANLQPYFSDNADFGLEWYTGGPGYVSANYFYKAITGFTENKQVTEPFSALGIPLSSLNATQLGTGIGLNTPITVTQPVNIDNAYIKGEELIWVQPIDFPLRGFGVTSNYTHITSTSFSQGEALGVLPGIPKYTYNVGGWYENHNISLHVTYVYSASFVSAPSPQNNVNVPLIQDARGQLDFSGSYSLPTWWGVDSQVTFGATNLTNQPIRTVFGYENAPYQVFYPGAAYYLGLRAKF